MMQRLARQLATMREKMWLTVDYGEGVTLSDTERQNIKELCQLHGCRVSFLQQGMLITKEDCSKEKRQ